MITSVQKWGNSLGVRIPRAFANAVKIEQGTEVDLALENGHLVITPAGRRSFELAELLARVTPENLHGEIDSDGRMGREVW